VHESIVLFFLPPTCIGHPVAILLHDYWAIYTPPPLDLPCVCLTPYMNCNNNLLLRLTSPALLALLRTRHRRGGGSRRSRWGRSTSRSADRLEVRKKFCQFSSTRLHICICVCVCVWVYIYTHIYIERERGRLVSG